LFDLFQQFGSCLTHENTQHKNDTMNTLKDDKA